MKYIVGNTIQGKRKTKSYKIHKVESVPQEEWVRVENTHPAIIDKQLFEKAQNLSKKDTKSSQKTKELSVWAGFLKCGDCKRAMNKKSSTNKNGTKYEYYICSTYRKRSNHLCSKHTIKVEDLEKAVLQAINFHIDTFLEVENVVKQIKNSKNQNTNSNNITPMIVKKQNEISKISHFKKALYEDWKNEDITKEEYKQYKHKYEKDIEELKQIIERLEKEKQKNERLKEKENEWIETFRKQKEIQKLSRNIMIELIDCIYIKEDGNITIKFNFKQELKPKSLDGFSLNNM